MALGLREQLRYGSWSRRLTCLLSSQPCRPMACQHIVLTRLWILPLLHI